MNKPSPKALPAPAGDDALFDYALIRDHVGFVLRSAGRNKLLFAACFLAVLGAAALLLKGIPLTYQVQATVLAQRNPIMGTLSNPTLNRDGDAPARAARETVMRRQNLVALLKQTDFAARHVATRAPLARAKAWLGQAIAGQEPDPEEVLDGFADALEKRLWVTVGTEGTVTIGFVWTNPELAFQLVEAAVQSYLEARHAAEVTAIGEAVAILQAHDARVQREALALAGQLEAKERTLRRSGPRPPVAPRPRVASEGDEDLARLEATLVARQRALTDLEDFRHRRLEDLQAQLAQQVNVYASQHPIVMSTRKSIESMSVPSPQVEQLRLEVQELEATIKRRGCAISSRLVGDPTAALASYVESRARIDDGDARLEYERNQLRALLRQHANLLDRIDAARLEMDTAQAAFKYRYSVVSPPQMPKRTNKPFGLILLGSGLVGGLAFAFFATTVADARSGRVLERWQLERRASLPVLAEPRRRAPVSAPTRSATSA